MIWARRGDTERRDITSGLLELNGTSVSFFFAHLRSSISIIFFGRSFLDASCFLSSVYPYSFWQTRLCPYLASHLPLIMMRVRCWLVGPIFTDIISVYVFVGSFSSIRQIRSRSLSFLSILSIRFLSCPALPFFVLSSDPILTLTTRYMHHQVSAKRKF